MAHPRLVLLLAALTACSHVPPDVEARVVKKTAPKRVTPKAARLVGAWHSEELRGALAELGHFAVYVFNSDGSYTGALVSDEVSTAIEGTYVYRRGTLEFDGGALRFRVQMVGRALELVSEDSYLRLVRLRPLRTRSVPGP